MNFHCRLHAAMEQGISLQSRTALCVDCTNRGFAYLASQFPQILAHMQFALVQLLFIGGICRQFTRLATADSMRRWSRRISLQGRTALCVDFTNGGFAFLASPFPQLLAHMQFVLVQLLFHGGICREFTRISTANSMRRWSRRTSFQRRTALCVDCTYGGFTDFANPFSQLLAHMQFAIVQLLFIGVVCREFTRISTADSMRDGAGSSVCKVVPLCALIAQTQRLRYCPPHSYSFLLICSLH